VIRGEQLPSPPGSALLPICPAASGWIGSTTSDFGAFITNIL
jgi:hypothetical protein